MALEYSYLRGRADPGVRLDLDVITTTVLCTGNVVHRGNRGQQRYRLELRLGPYVGTTIGPDYNLARVGLGGILARYENRFSLHLSLRAGIFAGSRSERPALGPEGGDFWGLDFVTATGSIGARLTSAPVYVGLILGGGLGGVFSKLNQVFGSLMGGLFVEAPW